MKHLVDSFTDSTELDRQRQKHSLLVPLLLLSCRSAKHPGTSAVGREKQRSVAACWCRRPCRLRCCVRVPHLTLDSDFHHLPNSLSFCSFMEGMANSIYPNTSVQQPAPVASASSQSQLEPTASAASDNAASDARDARARAIQESREGVWYLKDIYFNNQYKRIVTQNYNG